MKIILISVSTTAWFAQKDKSQDVPPAVRKAVGYVKTDKMD